MSENIFVLKKSTGELVNIDAYEGIEVTFRGNNALVQIEEGAIFKNCKVIIGHDSKIIIDKTAPRGILNTQIDMGGQGRNKLLSIGKDSSIESCRFAMANESNLSINIGQNCMMSSNIVFRPTDGHSIFDLDTKKILNCSKPIIIGDNVWIGASAVILKGAKISNDSIIGTCAVVAKKFEQHNIAIAGNPARVVKENIGWSRRYIEDFKNADFIFS